MYWRILTKFGTMMHLAPLRVGGGIIIRVSLVLCRARRRCVQRHRASCRWPVAAARSARSTRVPTWSAAASRVSRVEWVDTAVERGRRRTAVSSRTHPRPVPTTKPRPPTTNTASVCSLLAIREIEGSAMRGRGLSPTSVFIPLFTPVQGRSSLKLVWRVLILASFCMFSDFQRWCKLSVLSDQPVL